jgi:universal stress protein A
MVELRYVLVPIDFSPTSLSALEYARGLVAATRAPGRIELLTVVDASAVDGVLGHADPALWEKLLSQARTRLAELAGDDPLTVLEGKPADVIVDHAQAVNADLIVMGSQGRTGVQRLMVGSVAERVVRHAPCPVLVVRAGTA